MSGDLRFSVSVDEVSPDEPTVQKKPAAEGWDVVGGRVQTLPGDDIQVEHAAPEPENGIEVEIERAPRSRGGEADGGIDELQARYERENARADYAEQTQAAYDAAII